METERSLQASEAVGVATGADGRSSSIAAGLGEQHAQSPQVHESLQAGEGKA